MRGNRKSDLLGDSASRRSGREEAAEQYGTGNGGMLFDEEYRASGSNYPGGPAPAAEDGKAVPETPTVNRRRSYDEALAASENSRVASAPGENDEEQFDPLPLRYHPQTEGFIPEVRAERGRLRGRAPEAAGKPETYGDTFESEEEEIRLPGDPGTRRAAYAESEERTVPPLPRRDRKASYGGYNDGETYDDNYEAWGNERRRTRLQASGEMPVRSRREREIAAVPQSRAEIICPKCKAVNPQGARFCNGCGANIENLRTSSEGKRSYTRRSTPEAEANYESRKQQIVAIYSPKGGVGKSTITKELAYMLAGTTDINGRDIRVIVVDVDLEMPDVSTLFRVLPRPNIADWVRDIEADKEAGRPLRYDQDEISTEYVVHVNPNLHLLCGTESVTDSHMIKSEHIQTILSALKQCDYDIIMLDCSNGINAKILRTLMMADSVLWITTMDHTTLEETKRALKALRQMQCDTAKIKMLLNNIPAKEREKQYNIADIEGFIGMPITQGIPYDPNSRLANNAAEALVLGASTPFTKAIRKIGNELLPLQEEEKGGLFSRLFGKRKD